MTKRFVHLLSADQHTAIYLQNLPWFCIDLSLFRLQILQVVLSLKSLQANFYLTGNGVTWYAGKSLQIIHSLRTINGDVYGGIDDLYRINLCRWLLLGTSIEKGVD